MSARIIRCARCKRVIRSHVWTYYGCGVCRDCVLDLEAGEATLRMPMQLALPWMSR